jgi:hypothetical protein
MRPSRLGYLGLQVGEPGGVQDHVVLVVVLPDLPEAAPQRLCLRRERFAFHLLPLFLVLP